MPSESKPYSEHVAVLREACEGWPTPNRYTEALDGLLEQLEAAKTRELHRTQDAADHYRKARELQEQFEGVVRDLTIARETLAEVSSERDSWKLYRTQEHERLKEQKEAADARIVGLENAIHEYLSHGRVSKRRILVDAVSFPASDPDFDPVKGTITVRGHHVREPDPASEPNDA